MTADHKTMLRPARLLLALAATLTLSALLPGLASAASGPCVPGQDRPRCTFQFGKVDFVADGDTIRVKVDGSPGIKNVRFVGVNAMELTRYSKYRNRRRGECHGVAATNLVERYIRRSGGRVRLSAQSLSSRTGKRLYRSVAVKSGGGWRDLGRILLESGMALWLPQDGEWAHNDEYRLLAQRAEVAKKGLYAPSSCGGGPDDDVPMSVSVNWDAEGNDAENRNGEWVLIRNLGTREIDLGGWWVRDSFLRRAGSRVPGYTIPAGTRIPAGGSFKLHSGCGSNSGTDHFWCQSPGPFENVSYDGRGMGDGAYLFDPQGDMRASSIYPCALSCADHLQGKVELGVSPEAPESVDVRNVSGETVDLHGYILKLHNQGQRDSFASALNFGDGYVIPAGQTLRIDIGSRLHTLAARPGRGLLPSLPSSGAQIVRLWNNSDYLLADGGGVMSLRNLQDVVIDCDDWGRFRC